MGLWTGPLAAFSALRVAYILPLLHPTCPDRLALGRQSNTPLREHWRQIIPSRPQISPKPLTSRPAFWLQVLSTRTAAILPGNDKCSVVVKSCLAGPTNGEPGNAPPPERPMARAGTSLPPHSQPAGGAGPEGNTKGRRVPHRGKRATPAGKSGMEAARREFRGQSWEGHGCVHQPSSFSYV